MTGWTAETSARAAKPETQIDGHARPDPRGALIIDACMVLVIMVGEGGSVGAWFVLAGGSGGRRGEEDVVESQGPKQAWEGNWKSIQPHDANHHLFSALWDQCMEHGCRHGASNCSVFLSSLFPFERQQKGLGL